MTDDLISRQAAIDTVLELDASQRVSWKDAVIDVIDSLPSVQPDLDETCEDCKEYDSERHCCPRFSRVIKTTVDELRQAAQTERKWIPCSERLPEDNDYKPFSYYEDGAVLICAKSGSIGFGWYYESTKSWANEDDRGVDVIAWTPLPEPYEEGEQDATN